MISEQFEIGPVSEASIGNIQALYPQQGFVDHVITPTAGMGWMVGEDALDKYVIEYVESRTRNLWVRRLVRTWLNPSRSYANLMGFRKPWTRDSRPGVGDYDPNAWRIGQANIRPSCEDQGPTGDNFIALPSRRADKFGLGGGPNVKIPVFELAAHYDFFHHSQGGSSSGGCNGGGATGTFYMNRWLGAVVDISGCRMLEPGANLSGDSLTYLFGPRFIYRNPNRLALYLDLKIGGNKLTQELVLPEKIPTGGSH